MKKSNTFIVVFIIIAIPAIFIVALITTRKHVNQVNTDEGESYLYALEQRGEKSTLEPAIDNPDNIISGSTEKNDKYVVPNKPEDVDFNGFYGSNQEDYIPYYFDVDEAKKTADKVENGKLSAKQVFKDTVFIGDSVVTGFDVYKLANTKNVIASVGAFLEKHFNESIDTAIDFEPDNIVIRYGLNEMDHNKESRDAFLRRYRDGINRLKKALPSARIVVMGISPINIEAADNDRFSESSDYNECLRKMCVDLKVGYCEDSDMFINNKEFYSKDGIHFHPELYNKLVYRLISEMGIY